MLAIYRTFQVFVLTLIMISLPQKAQASVPPKKIPPPYEFHPNLSPLMKEALKNDFLRLRELRFEGIPKESLFTQAFGGTTSRHVILFIENRIHYLYEDRGSPLPRQLERPLNEASGENRWSIPLPLENAMDYFQDETPIETVRTELSQRGPLDPGIAHNFSVEYWLESILHAPDYNVNYSFGTAQINAQSSRVGVIGLKPIFVLFKPMARLALLVHEARHSDCTGGITQDHLVAFLKTRSTTQIDQPACGHAHVKCNDSDSHSQCDAQLGGAFSFEAVFLDAVANHCQNCTNSEKRQASFFSQRAWERVLDRQSGQIDPSSAGLR